MTRASDRLALARMIAEGAGALRRYRGLFASLYAVQLALAALAGWIATSILATAFARRPLFDAAVDGDVVAFLIIAREQPLVLASVIWASVAVVAAYVALSWFLVGGLNATLLARATPGRDVATTFGAGGAASFFAYVRLALLCIAPYLIIAGVGLAGAGAVTKALPQAMTLGDAARVVAPRLAPAIVLVWFQWTVVDYARIELVRAPEQAAWRALAGAYRSVLGDWRLLAHTGLYAACFVLASGLYVAALHGRAMEGTLGALLLVAIRQALAALRFAAKMVCAAGQVARAAHLD